MDECVRKIQGYVDELNKGNVCVYDSLYYTFVDLSVLSTRGPCSKYSIIHSTTGNEITGKIEFKLTEEIFKVLISAVNLTRK